MILQPQAIHCIISVCVKAVTVEIIPIHQRRVVNVRVLVVRRIIRHVPLGHPVVVIHLMNCAVPATRVKRLMQQLMVRFIVWGQVLLHRLIAISLRVWRHQHWHLNIAVIIRGLMDMVRVVLLLHVKVVML